MHKEDITIFLCPVNLNLQLLPFILLCSQQNCTLCPNHSHKHPFPNSHPYISGELSSGTTELLGAGQHKSWMSFWNLPAVYSGGYKKYPSISGTKAWWPSSSTDLTSDLEVFPKQLAPLLDIGSTLQSMVKVHSVPFLVGKGPSNYIIESCYLYNIAEGMLF